MDYEDIYNRFKAGGQNVNIRNGHAPHARRALKPVTDSNLCILQKSGYFQKVILLENKSKENLHTAPHSKGIITF